MKNKFKKFLIIWEKTKQKKRELNRIKKHPFFKIKKQRNTSIVLGCLGGGINSQGNRVITWNSVIIFNETKKISLKTFTKNLYNEWKKSGKTLEDFMNIKVQNFPSKINSLLTKFKLSVKRNKTTIDFLNDQGTVVFRGIEKNIEKYLTFINKSGAERKKLISEMYKRIDSKPNKYNPKNAVEKGYDDIPISRKGKGTSPDFDGLAHYLYNNDIAFGRVKIKVTGSRDKDFVQAFEKMKIFDFKTQKSIKEKYTWHHLDNIDENLEGTMQLVLREVHDATITHFGSAGQFQDLLGITEKYL